ncbi:hypothetical protein OROGR_008436 [Orobanche gracilis]
MDLYSKCVLEIRVEKPISDSSKLPSVEYDANSFGYKTPFGYTRKDVILIGLGVTFMGIGLKSGLEIKLGTPGYKERYYREKFSVDGLIEIEKKRKDIVHKYTEGLVWVLQYYFSGVASWSWFYPYHYGPFASDLKGMGQVKVNFEKGVPFSPFHQLLSVLPPRSAYALPISYSKLMIDEDSKILDWYPQDFEVDKEGKRFLWQAVCKLPWIDEKQLLTETREIQGLSGNEKIRNSVKVDSLFFISSSKLSTKFSSLSADTNQPKLETSISDDNIGGIISLCLEDVEKPYLDMENCEKKKEDKVMV